MEFDTGKHHKNTELCILPSVSKFSCGYKLISKNNSLNEKEKC